MTVHHATLTLERSLKAPPAKVWNAYADPDARSVWGVPSPDINMTFQEADFRAGGRDLCVCGPGPAEGVTVETLYHSIEHEARIVTTEIIGMPGAPDAVTLVTVQFAATANGTQLTVTIQATSLAGPEMEAELRGGWEAALANLAAYAEGRDLLQRSEQ
ncbi:MAG: SRPBCC domain-containing protein [Pseudomonadota bacterium]